MRAIPNSGPLPRLGSPNIDRVFPPTPEALKVVLHAKDYAFSKLPRATNKTSNILGKKRLLFAKERKVQRKLLLPAFPHAHIKGLVSGFWSNGVEMFENVAGVMRASQSGAGGWRKGRVGEMRELFSLVTLGKIGSYGFSYEFRVLESASISGISNTKEKSGSRLADAYNTIFNMGGRLGS
ncbi:hypothetical protein B9Z19DRAFT_181475 [Tuber borchii]|uniref:Uncharacterized protein n=1 Tax=Tuber borchii TaxID=42251 RepID=A0A2T6ZP02_TUBBO|nr:hypothetical protein B9Z19DRAFT_181475 [Tuber borchii]